ncbi:hypothetical protein OnM2_046004 [Erysiphe neolycopersici]|uniref:Uncharacterized protein n=1 Tax=Erysiphe neolycopersici TaxID=212602 RepID=A0A420HU39_9PEZI|nr:hypothetical protein OnM2_046004 [Erysiphe neolycopersici]
MNHQSTKEKKDAEDNFHSLSPHANRKFNWNYMPQPHCIRIGEYEDYRQLPQVYREQDQKSNLKYESHIINTNPAHTLEVLRSRMAATISKIGREVTSMNSSNLEEFFHEFQNLFHDFKRAQVSLLEEYDRISEAKASYHEQFTLARSKLLQIYDERDRLAKEVENIQQVLDETRDVLKNPIHRNLQFKYQKLACKDMNISRGDCTRLLDNIDENLFITNLSALEISARTSMSGSKSSPNRSFENLKCASYITRAEHILDTSSESSFSFGSHSTSIPERQHIYHDKHILSKKSSISNLSEVKKRNTIQKENSYNTTYNVEDDPAPGFKVNFDNLLKMIEEWCRTNADQTNEQKLIKVILQNPSLWSYMMDCADCGSRDASESRVKELINSANTKYWFIMRMATTYIFKDLLSLKNFYGFSEEANNMLHDFESKMEERGMTAIMRQGLVDRRDTIIKNITKDEDYKLLRSSRITQHSNSLRGILGSLLNEDCNFASAGRDLGAIVTLAFDLCESIHSSALTFQIFFPNLSTTKYNASTMIVRDKIFIKPLALNRVTMTRLKLVISPMVTLRDDRGTTIKAKSLQLASVLTII